jgi:2'-5' RNA ligase
VATGGDPIGRDRPDTGSIRAFVAILIDDTTRAALAAEIDRLRAAAPRVAWVAAANLHFTLKFLGQVDPALVEPLTRRLQAALHDAPAFDLDLAGLGAFPTAARPRVVWVGVVAGHAPMRGIAERVETALEPMGFARASRPFSPHLTLGRVRDPRRDDRLAALIDHDAGRSFGSFRVHAASLMRSVLSPRGSQYSEINTVSLSGH